MSEELLDLLRKRSDYRKLQYYVKKTALEKSITKILKQINKDIKKEAKKVI
ncbi:MAG: hypothetical protein ACTSR8_20875 [Promethearchaeota archaeon]